jgi:hypothetical protein
MTKKVMRKLRCLVVIIEIMLPVSSTSPKMHQESLHWGYGPLELHPCGCGPSVQALVCQFVEGKKWVTGVVQKIKNNYQWFLEVKYTVLDGSKKSVVLHNIHCCPGTWADMTPTPVAPLFGLAQRRNTFINLLQAPSYRKMEFHPYMNLKQYVISSLILTL